MFCNRDSFRLSAVLALALFLGLSAQAAEPSASHLLLRGDIVTPSGLVRSGWLDIRDGRIIHITQEKPDEADARVLETDDIIFPGFIDLHNHPAFNIFPRWTPPHQFANRYAWRDFNVYRSTLEKPQRALAADPSTYCDVDEFVELKALIGGTTSMVGMTAPKPSATAPDCVKGLVRNLGLYSGFYGDEANERIANSIGILPRDMDANTGSRYAQSITSGSLDLLAIHIAEGLPTDEESAQELDLLEARGLLTAHTVLIHGVGLSAAQMARVHRAGSAVVWSPHSNFVLYGATANVQAAFREGVPLALAPDWSPTGSDNMLDEIKYAWAVSNKDLDGLFSARQLVEMASSVPARIARIDDKVGTLTPGNRADLFLLRRTAKASQANAYEALVASSVSDIDLVMVDGIAIYGEPALLKQVVSRTEALTLCGRSRALNADALPGGPFAQVTSRLSEKLKAAGAELGPLSECVE